MSIEARVAYSGEMPIIELPLDRVARELFLLILQREKILEDIDLRDLPSQGAFAVEGPVAKFGIACFVQEARLTHGGKCLMHQHWLRLHSLDPAQDLAGLW